MPIELPNGWRPRAYQRPMWDFLEKGGKNAVGVWHRRSGKDSLMLNFTAVAAHQRKGVYWHMLPEAEQARKAVWNGIDREGRRIIDQVFPPELRAGYDKQTMTIELKCGSMWQLVGSDNFNSLVGSNPVGVVYSEFSIANPAARDFLRPIMKENGGWQAYIYTPRGKNHGYDLYQTAKRLQDRDGSWYASLLTVDDTGILTPKDIQDERDSGMDEDMIRQEYYCSFEAAMRGAYYGDLFEKIEKEGRLKNVPYDPAVPVETWWDLGIGDSTAIWFIQRVGQEWRAIDYLEASGQGLEYYARALFNKPYAYSRHVGPFDLTVRELGTGKSRLEMLAALGLRMDVAPKLRPDDGIQAVRQVLPLFWFDSAKCEAGVKALSQYRRAYDDKAKMFKDHPLHDWTSHAADAFRTGIVADGRRAATGFNRALTYRKLGVA
jgi:phage terminase large subunit